MGIYQEEIDYEEKDYDLCCDKCGSHYLFEIFCKENIFLRKYCFCGESISEINNHIQFLLIKKAHFVKSNQSSSSFGLSNYDNCTKYCPKCNLFLNDEFAVKHEHKNLVNSKDYEQNCFFHRNLKLIGFCKNCKKPVCEECIKIYWHKNHNIKYTKNLIITEEYIENFNNQLNKAFLELNEFIKFKYNNTKFKINITNLAKMNNISDYNKKEQQIILTLELLKTILDVFNYHKTKNSLNYQIISNLLKHNNIKIIRKDIFNKMDKFACISSDSQSNKKIVIDLKIELNDIENRENQINIEFDRIIEKSVTKIIKLNNGDLALSFFMPRKIYLFKNLKEENNYLLEEEEYIKDFIQLNNNKLIIVLDHKIKIYNFNNQSLILETEKSFDDIYYNQLIQKIEKIDLNSFAILTNHKDNGYSLFLYKDPLYQKEEIKLSIKSYDGDLIQMDNNLIII